MRETLLCNKNIIHILSSKALMSTKDAKNTKSSTFSKRDSREKKEITVTENQEES